MFNLFEQVIRYNVVWDSLCLINREAVANQVILDHLIFTTKKRVLDFNYDYLIGLCW